MSGADLAGLTRDSCAGACSKDGCVLGAGRAICMHPCKGGVPLHLANDPVLQKLKAEAREMLGFRPALMGA
jgi:hypothetical protein